MTIAQLFYDARAGQTVARKEVNVPRLYNAISLSTNHGGGDRVFKELPFSAPVQFLKVLVEERRKVDLQGMEKCPNI